MRLRLQNMVLFKRWSGLRVAWSAAEQRVAAALFLWGVGEGLWMYIRPLYIAELGGSPVEIGQVLGLAGLGAALVMLPTGRLIDRFGPRRLMIPGWWLGLAGTVGLALAPDWRWSIPAFVLYAVSSFAVPAINAYIAQEAMAHHASFDPRVAQSAIARTNAAYLSGAILSPLAGGWLGELFGLRAVFWISAVWFVLSLWVVLGAPGLTGSRPLAGEPQRAISITPGRWFSVVQARVFVSLAILFFFMAMGYTLVPTYLENVLGLPIGLIGGLGAATAAGGVFWMLALRQRPPRLALMTAIGLVALALAALLYGSTGWAQLPILIGVYFLLGVYQTARVLSLSVASQHVSTTRRGTSFGLVEMLFGLGSFFGPAAAGWLYGGVSAQTPFLVALAVLLALLGLGWFIFRPPNAQAGLNA